ncbi:trypsin-3-like isoform X1 [Diorhabda sublineata]|uniref:trypsin-3-like isoform X1 n=1 Tax=Diorhabda sublineata TaxID=1163346 RepID=UPI0024E0FA83|nr:trypsin-3-like isoform X1 [Diorhabda sublineata]XP_056641077.1 trypsin-3-like isoform X1 [Diorhabda sublineata]XP_056641078.1 trypsin-3-like isoform X1 [Diorhabda sublineata]XP_056641079.1 trypsin-3-like isoform X1 [Diorhabda sublineata]
MLSTYCAVLVPIIIVLNFPYFISAENLKIIGGNETTIEKHPWMVSIQFLSNHLCGGSIINEDTIITAAHCFDEISSGLTIVSGITDLSEAEASVRVMSIIIHEDYDSATIDSDIAIMKLSENLTYSEKIQPILLPEENVEVPDGTLAITSGWGLTSEEASATSDILMEIEIPVIDWNLCTKLLPVTERMMCAGYVNGGPDTCTADSGGALELNTTLIGIVSWGIGCGEAGHPGVYTDVRRFRPWIREHTGM